MRGWRLLLSISAVVLAAALFLMLKGRGESQPDVGSNGLLITKPATTAVASASIPVPVPVPVPVLPSPSSLQPAPASLEAIYNTPVVFYGKVQDQDGTAIADANVKVAVADRAGGGSSKLALKSDQAGLFTITSKGMSLHVRVSKEGFEPVSGQEPSGQRSHGGFDYGMALENGIHTPDPARPVVFTLYRPSRNASLVVIEEQSLTIPKTGRPVVVNLAPNGGKPGRELVLRCWTNDTLKEKDGRYDWKLEIAVKGGGILERKDTGGHLAPADGYTSVLTMDMPRTLSRQQWDNDVKRTCWVKFEDQTFGRIDVRMIAGGDHFATVEGYINEQAGSRIFEVQSKP